MPDKKENNRGAGFIRDEFLTTRAEMDALLGPNDPQSAVSNHKSTDTDTRRILLIGDINKAFPDADTVRRLDCEIQTNMLDAIEMAGNKSFAAIAVVMSGSCSKLNLALKALRKINSDAKIILLAQMYQEPTAMQLVSPAFNGVAGMADDYLICPIQLSYLVSRISYLVNKNHRAMSVSEWEKQYATSRATCRADGSPRLRDTSRQVRKLVLSEPVPSAVEEVETAQYEKIKHLEKLATEDDLTGLKNRRYIWEFSRQIIKRAGRISGRVTLLVFDIDNFKHYNDVYGHLAGDEILKQAAVLMRRCCRSHDVVGRIGGDEFAVVFWDDPQRRVDTTEAERRSAQAEHPKEPIFIAERFRKELEKAELKLLGPEGKGVLAISGGLASFPRDGSTIQQLFGQADTALLEAKRSGKNRIYLVGKNNSI